MNVVITGSLSFDYIMNFSGRFADRIMPDKLHILSLSFLAEKLTKQFGGCATNLAYSLKLLGGEPEVLTAAGNDWGEYKKFLQKHKISTKQIKVFKNEPCSSYHVITDKDDNQIGAFYVGASRFNDQLHIPKNAQFVVIGPTDPKAMVSYVRQCQGKRYMYDPAFQIANFSDYELTQGIKGAEILIGNDYEIAFIQKKRSISVPILITTLGAKGSVIQTKKESIYCKAARVKKVVDPTGAGDAYRAGFLAGYLQGVSLQVAGQMGSVAAAYNVETYGTVTHHYTKKEFIHRYYENFGAHLPLGD